MTNSVMLRDESATGADPTSAAGRAGGASMWGKLVSGIPGGAPGCL